MCPVNKFKQQYVDILHKHQNATSANKYDLGLTKIYNHKIYLKDNNPVYRKQFKIPQSHLSFIEQFLDEWLKLGVVKRANTLYNLLIFCVPKNKVKVYEWYKISDNLITTHILTNTQ
jgi:hypothetical protein